jgi:hypothetical protein
LPTYRSGNDRGKAGDERLAWVVFNGGGDGAPAQGLLRQWRCRWGILLQAGVSGAAARQQHRGSAMAARVQAKFAQDRALLIGGFVPNRRRQKS